MQSLAETPCPAQRNDLGDAGGENPPEILILSSSLLTDRMLLHTRFLNVLREGARLRIWATSVRNPRFQRFWGASLAPVEEFPEVQPYRGFPHEYLRMMNEFVWDFHHRPPSRLSLWRHVRSNTISPHHRALKLPARAVTLFRAQRGFEDTVERLLLNYPRSRGAFERLRVNAPSVLVTTGPFQFEQPAVVASAKKLGIPTLALIPSWDNVSTKNRMVFKYDGYLVWSEQTKRELHRFYPYTRNAPVYVVGAPQFDMFFDERFYIAREPFCAMLGLRADLPIILYAIGSPNFLKEHHGALHMAKRVAEGGLGDVQLLVRPHPIHDNQELTEQFRAFGPRVVLQRTAEAGVALTARSQDTQQVSDWVNTFRHADVVVNLSSTVTVDAALFDRPVVNLDFDPEPGQPNQALVKDINHLWTHFSPLAESGGVWLVNDYEEMVEAVKTYLARPELHREQRRWMAEYVCQYLDGRCGERMARAILDFAKAANGPEAGNR